VSRLTTKARVYYKKDENNRQDTIMPVKTVMSQSRLAITKATVSVGMCVVVRHELEGFHFPL